MQHLEAVGWPPDYIALGLPAGVAAWRDRADGASNTAMRFENEMQPAALRHMAPGDRDLMAVLVEPCTGGFVLQIDINGAELLRDDADNCIGPELPPSANDRLLGAGVLKAPDSQRRLMAFGIGGGVLAWEHSDAHWHGSESRNAAPGCSQRPPRNTRIAGTPAPARWRRRQWSARRTGKGKGRAAEGRSCAL